MATNNDPILPSHHHRSTRFRESHHQLAGIRINRQLSKDFARKLRAFFNVTWLDWITLMIIGAIAAAVWVSPHHPTRYIAVTTPDGAIYWPELAYPYEKPIFSSTLAGGLAAAIPIAVILLAQLWLRSFENFSAALLGLAYSMVTGTCFQVILKKAIGGFRPHFLAVCQPVVPIGSPGVGYGQSMYTAQQICTGDPKRIENALESFPSGHAEVAFAGFGYLATYLFAHLRICSQSGRLKARYWKMVLVVAPVLFATYLSSTLVLGYHHHAHDVVFGALIGFFMAVFGYRMVFKAVIDGDWNTVPYLRLTSVGRERNGSPV